MMFCASRENRLRHTKKNDKLAIMHAITLIGVVCSAQKPYHYYFEFALMPVCLFGKAPRAVVLAAAPLFFPCPPMAIPRAFTMIPPAPALIPAAPALIPAAPALFSSPFQILAD